MRRAIRQADEPHALRQLLLSTGKAPSLRAWAEAAAAPGKREALLQLVDELNRLCFTAQPDLATLDRIKQALAKTIRNAADAAGS